MAFLYREFTENIFANQCFLFIKSYCVYLSMIIKRFEIKFIFASSRRAHTFFIAKKVCKNARPKKGPQLVGDRSLSNLHAFSFARLRPCFIIQGFDAKDAISSESFRNPFTITCF
jgi:hypothetical protein